MLWKGDKSLQPVDGACIRVDQMEQRLQRKDFSAQVEKRLKRRIHVGKMITIADNSDAYIQRVENIFIRQHF